MNKRLYKYSKASLIRGIVGTVIFFVIVLAAILVGLGNTGDSVKNEGQRVAEEAVRRAAVSCYALEGSYPESYEYIKENYGVNINEKLYVVNYNVFASNIMPDITVTER